MSFITSTPTRTLSSKIAENTFALKKDLVSAEKSKPWIIVNVFFTLFLTLDLVSGNFFTDFLAPNYVNELWIVVEKTILALVCFNSLFLIYTTIKPLIFVNHRNFSLTTRQAKLLGLTNHENLLIDQKSINKPTLVKTQRNDQSSLDLSWLFHLRDRSATSRKSMLEVNDLATSMLDSSFGVGRFGADESLTSSYAERLARMRRARSCSPFVSPARSLQSRDHLKKFLKTFKDHSVSYIDSPACEESSNTSNANFLIRSSAENSARAFFDESNSSAGILAPQSTPLNQSSPFNKSRMATPDFSRLSNRKYQVSPVVTIAECLEILAAEDKDSKSKDDSSTHNKLSMKPSEFSIWLKYDLDPDKLDLIVHNCRVWISKTIIQPLSHEIETLNGKLAEQQQQFLAQGQICVGQTSLHTLQQFACQKAEQWPNLAALLPYLQMTNDQALLVARIKSMSRGTCLASYDPLLRANVERRVEGAWTDFDVIFHALRVYLAGRCTPHVLNTFEFEFSRHFCQFPAKIPSTLHPIIFKMGVAPRVTLQYAGRELDAGGRGVANLFKIVVLFLQVLRQDFGAKLDGVSLGRAGLNMEWIFDV